MYLQDTAGRQNSTAPKQHTSEGTQQSPKNDAALRMGVALLLTSGAILGAINVLVMIRLVAAALGG